VLEAGELCVERRDGSFVVRYLDRVFPVAPPTYDAVLGAASARVVSDELAFLTRAFAALPPATATDVTSVAARHHDKEVLKGLLSRLYDERPDVADAVDRAVAAVNGD